MAIYTIHLIVYEIGFNSEDMKTKVKSDKADSFMRAKIDIRRKRVLTFDSSKE